MNTIIKIEDLIKQTKNIDIRNFRNSLALHLYLGEHPSFQKIMIGSIVNSKHNLQKSFDGFIKDLRADKDDFLIIHFEVESAYVYIRNLDLSQVVKLLNLKLFA